MVKNMSTIVLIIMKSVTVVTYSMDLNKEQHHWVILSSKTLNYECEREFLRKSTALLMSDS